MAVGDGFEVLFERGVSKLDDGTAFDTDQMIVMGTIAQFKNRLPPLKMAAADQPRPLELGEDPINRGQADLLALLEEFPIDLLSAEMTFIAALKDAEDLDARRRDLQPRLFDLVILQWTMFPTPSGLGAACLNNKAAV